MRSLMWSIAGGMLVAAVAASALGSAAGATGATAATCGKGTVSAVIGGSCLLQPFPGAPLRMVVAEPEERTPGAIDRSVETLSAWPRKSDVVVLARLHHATCFSGARATHWRWPTSAPMKSQ